MKLFQNAMSRMKGVRQTPFPSPAPARPVWVIGDIHGRSDLLDRLIEQIDRHPATQTPCDVITVGDYIDRGEDGRGVLERVSQWDGDIDTFTPIAGNHEAMMLDFLDNPTKAGRRWLRYGGLQTLASFGIGGLSETSRGDTLLAAAEQLKTNLPEGMLQWLQDLDTHWQSGNLHVVHAGAHPDTPIPTQSERVFLWGDDAFAQRARTDGQWVAYGHTVTDTPGPDARGRIAVDTGAYYSGKLTAALIQPDGHMEILQT